MPVPWILWVSARDSRSIRARLLRCERFPDPHRMLVSVQLELGIFEAICDWHPERGGLNSTRWCFQTFFILRFMLRRPNSGDLLLAKGLSGLVCGGFCDGECFVGCDR